MRLATTGSLCASPTRSLLPAFWLGAPARLRTASRGTWATGAALHRFLTYLSTDMKVKVALTNPWVSSWKPSMAIRILSEQHQANLQGVKIWKPNNTPTADARSWPSTASTTSRASRLASSRRTTHSPASTRRSFYGVFIKPGACSIKRDIAMAIDERRSNARRSGKDRRSGVDTRTEEKKRVVGERRSTIDRRSGLDRRSTAAPARHSQRRSGRRLVSTATSEVPTREAMAALYHSLGTSRILEGWRVFGGLVEWKGIG